jgi:DNA-binding NarL/FixJ family response regulator
MSLPLAERERTTAIPPLQPMIRPARIRIAIVDRQVLICEALRALLANEGDLEVVGATTDGIRAIEAMARQGSLVVLLDAASGRVAALAQTSELAERCPSVYVLALGDARDRELADELMRAGAKGFVLKTEPVQTLVAAIRRVAGGETAVSPALAPSERAPESPAGAAARDPDPLGVLTRREREVFDLLVEGHTNQKIATLFSVSYRTVETHRAHILQKLGLHSMADLVRFAIRHRLLGRERGDNQP